jgi:hypothetical protein
MDALRIPVVKIDGGYLKAILLNGQEIVFGRDEKELIGRLKFRTGMLGAHAHQVVEQALDIRR